jgi:hypothetical protein
MMATAVAWVLGRLLLPNLAFVVIGIALGVLQFFVLQHRLRRAWRWIPATILGWWLGAVIVTFLLPSSMDFLAGVITGLSLGVAQWLVLRRELAWSAWWIVVNIVAWTTGYALLPGVLLTGVMAGLITGTALGLLLMLPRPALTQEG